MACALEELMEDDYVKKGFFFFFFEAIGKLYHLDDLPADYFFNYTGCFSIWFACFAGDEHHLDGLLARCACGEAQG